MGRVWVDFVNVNDSPIISTDLGGLALESRSLSEGATTQSGRGAAVDSAGWTRVLSLPLGTVINAHRIGAHLRGYLITGSVQMERGKFREGLFFEVHPGGEFPFLEALEPCTLFLTVEGNYIADLPASNEPTTLAHVLTSQWRAAVVKDLPSGAARKPLGDHDDFGAGILGVLPGWDSPFDEWHTFSEEIYILSGSMSTSFGVMRAGDYLSHPAGSDTNHGPVFSHDGSTMLVLRHGPIGNTYTPAPPGELERVRGLD